MGIAYRCSAEHRCTFIGWHDDVTPAEWWTHNDRMFADPAFPAGPRILADLRSAGGAPSISDEVITEMGRRLSEQPDQLADVSLAIVPNGSLDKARQLVEHEVSVPALTAMMFNVASTACVWLGLPIPPVYDILDELRTGLRHTSEQ